MSLDIVLPPHLQMRVVELKRGHSLAGPGHRPYFPASDWHEDSFLSFKGNEVRIVLIRANQPHQGALKRLIAGIKEAGLVPVVVCPMVHLEEILQRWGWHGELVHPDNWDLREDIWRE